MKLTDNAENFDITDITKYDCTQVKSLKESQTA